MRHFFENFNVNVFVFFPLSVSVFGCKNGVREVLLSSFTVAIAILFTGLTCVSVLSAAKGAVLFHLEAMSYVIPV